MFKLKYSDLLHLFLSCLLFICNDTHIQTHTHSYTITHTHYPNTLTRADTRTDTRTNTLTHTYAHAHTSTQTKLTHVLKKNDVFACLNISSVSFSGIPPFP